MKGRSRIALAIYYYLFYVPDIWLFIYWLWILKYWTWCKTFIFGFGKTWFYFSTNIFWYHILFLPLWVLKVRYIALCTDTCYFKPMTHLVTGLSLGFCWAKNRSVSRRVVTAGVTGNFSPLSNWLLFIIIIIYPFPSLLDCYVVFLAQLLRFKIQK